MPLPVPPNRELTWVTFCRGDRVVVKEDTLPANDFSFTLVINVEGECVHTADGYRWQQGTGNEILFIRSGRVETTDRRRLRLAEKGRGIEDRNEWTDRSRT